MSQQQYLVSALVSVYNSRQFIEGCLADLMGQTLYGQGLLQIVVVDSGSEQGEGDLLRQLEREEPHLLYLRTERETLYAAWNRAIELASGRYLTNANTDDRHRGDALEVLARALDEHQDVDLVYGDCYLSKIPNETFEQNGKGERYRYPDYFAPAALLHYQFGPQSMWRRSLHGEIGLFDGSFKAAGDYDFNIRFALKRRALHLDQVLGLYLEHGAALSHKDDTMARENERIASQYRNPQTALKLYQAAGVPVQQGAQTQADALLDMANRALCFFPPWSPQPECNLPFAVACLEEASRLTPGDQRVRHNLAFCYWAGGNPAAARELVEQVAGVKERAALSGFLDALAENGGEGCVVFASGLNFPVQSELAGNSASSAVAAQGAPDHRGGHNGSLTICMVASVAGIDPSAPCGGLETAMQKTAAALAQRGHRVALVGNLAQAMICDGVQYLPFGQWQAGAFPEFSGGADVLAFASGPDLFCYKSVGEGAAKVLLFHHQELRHLLSDNPLQVVNSVADRVICVSAAVRDNLAAGGALPDRLRVVPNGVDRSIFYPRQVGRQPQRLLFVGALVPEKNVDLLISAFIALQDAFPAAELHICGAASLWGSSEYLDREQIARLSNRVFFHGVLSHDELALQYSMSAVCVIPSQYESFSLVSLEAQSCGCVPLVAEVGGVPETLMGGKTGFIYSPNTLEALTYALGRLLRDQEALSLAATAAPAFVEENFSWKATAERYEAVFREAISDRSNTVPCAPLVSVVIACYNYGRYLEDAVVSVLSQTLRDFEIIIVNDGSTDDSAAIAQHLIERFPAERIELINQANSGHPSFTRNAGLARAAGKYLLVLDADDMLAPQFLERCVELLEQDPAVAIAYTDRRDFDGVDQVVLAGEYDFRQLKYQNFLSYCALYRREVWECTGGYRKVGCEDWEFWIRAGASGFIGRRIAQPLFYYRRHDSGRFQADMANFESVVAEIILMNRNCYNHEDIAAAEGVLMKPSITADSRHDAWQGQPLVSVIVPTYNRPDTLTDALRSILRQSYRNFEIIVVNDAGADVAGIVGMLNAEGRITYLRHGRNAGLAAARNSGLKLAKGKYVAYLDDDDIFYENHLETLVSFLEKSPCKVAYTDAHRTHQLLQQGRYCVTGHDVPYSFDFDNDAILVSNFVPVLCFMHERGCVEETGFFDETLTTHEDWDMWLRMSRKFSFAHIKAVTCSFTWREDGSTMSSSKAADFQETERRIFEKYRHLAVGKPQVLEAQRRAVAARAEAVARAGAEHPSATPGGAEVPEQLIARADELMLQGSYYDALSLYRCVAGTDPGNPAAQVGCGVAWLMLEEPERAAAAFKVAVQLAPESSRGWSGLGMALAAQGRHYEAFDAFGQALALDPGNITPLHEFVKLAYQLNLLDRAEPCLDAYLRYHPADFDILYALAGVCYRLGRLAKAMECLESIRVFNPEYQGLADLMGMVLQAEEAAETSAGLQGRLAEGSAAASAGDLQKAQQIYEEILDEDPICVAALIGVGVTRLMDGKDRKAADAFTRALKHSPDDSKALCGLGMTRAVQEREEEAFRFYKRALQSDPENQLALHELLKMGYQLELLEEAEPFLVEFLRRHPADLDILFSLAGLRYRIGAHRPSLDALETVLAFSPQYPGAAELHEMVLAALEDPAGVLLLTEQVTEE